MLSISNTHPGSDIANLGLRITLPPGLKYMGSTLSRTQKLNGHWGVKPQLNGTTLTWPSFPLPANSKARKVSIKVRVEASTPITRDMVFVAALFQPDTTCFSAAETIVVSLQGRNIQA